MSMGLCPTLASRAREPRYKILPQGMSVYFPKAHGLFFMMEIVFLFRITSRNLAMEYHFIQREGSNNTDRFMLVALSSNAESIFLL